MSDLWEGWKKELLQQTIRREQKGERRRLLPQSDANVPLYNFASNDYLGHAQKKMDTWLQDGHGQRMARLSEICLGSTGSRLLTGNHSWVEETEKVLEDFFQGEMALLFSSGYEANVGVLSSLPKENDVILFDEYVHASLREGIRLSKGQSFPFRHNDLVHLERRLQSQVKPAQTLYVVVESLYSMDGDLSPLKELCSLCESFGAILIVDEAHGTGVYSAFGEGRVVAEGLQQRIPIRIYTFGKAVGLQGGCVVGPVELKDYLINFCSHFIYTTASTPLACFLLQEQILAIKGDHGGRKKLQQQVEFFREGFLQRKLEKFYHSPSLTRNAGEFSPIIPLFFRPELQSDLQQNLSGLLKELSGYLRKQGVLVLPIMSPTVPRGKERLRISFQVQEDDRGIELLLDGLQRFATTRLFDQGSIYGEY